MPKSDAQSHTGTALNRRQLLGATAAVGLSSACAPFPATAQSQPTKGRTLRLGMQGGSASDSLNPLTYADSIPISMGLMLWNNLIEIDDKGDATGELFENWEVKPGAAEWIFNIRKDVIFTSGKTLDADDVIYSLNMHRGESRSPAKLLLTDITEIKKLSASQIQIAMKSGRADLPYHLADYHLMIVPSGFKDWSKPDGTGAFLLEEFRPGVRATFQRKPGNYWKPNRGNFDAVELRYISDTAARTQALTSGAVDVINRVDPRTAALLARNRDMRLSRTQGMGNRFAFVAQTDKVIYNNKDLMLALKHGIDRQKIIDNVFSGYAVLGNDHLVGPRVKFHDDKQAQTPFDPDKARFHYRKSGLNAPAIELQVSEGAFSGATDCAVIFQESTAKAGIKIDVKRVSGDGYWDHVWLKQPFCAVYWGNRPTIDNQLTVTFKAGGSWNDSHFANAEFEDLLLKSRVELDQNKRAQQYARMQELVRDNGGMIHFATQDYLDAHSTRLQGLTPSGRYAMGDCRIAEKGWFA